MPFWLCAPHERPAGSWIGLASCRREGRLRGGNGLTENARAGRIGGFFRVRGEQQGLWRCAAHDADFAHATLNGALGGFEFQDHASGNDPALDEAIDFSAIDGGKNSLAIEHACDVGEIDQLVGIKKLRASRRHMIRVDVVELVVCAYTEAWRYGQQPLAPQRLDELQVHASEVPNVAQAAFHFVVHYGLSKETTRVRRRNSYGWLTFR